MFFMLQRKNVRFKYTIWPTVKELLSGRIEIQIYYYAE